MSIVYDSLNNNKTGIN